MTSEFVLNTSTPPKMLARKWTGLVPLHKLDEYSKYLHAGGPQHFSTLEGNLGSQMFVKVIDDTAEFTVISYWEYDNAEITIHTHLGTDTSKAWNLKQDNEFLLEIPAVEHFHVLADDRIDS